MAVSSGQPFAATKIRQKNGHAFDFLRLPFAAFQFLVVKQIPIICGDKQPPSWRSKVTLSFFCCCLIHRFLCRSFLLPKFWCPSCCPKRQPEETRDRFSALLFSTCPMPICQQKRDWLSQMTSAVTGSPGYSSCFVGDYYATQLY